MAENAEWVTNTRKRLREERDAAEKEATEKEAEEAARRAQDKVVQKARKHKGEERLKEIRKFIREAAETVIPHMGPGQICLIEFRSRMGFVGLATVPKRKEGVYQVVHPIHYSALSFSEIRSITWSDDGNGDGGISLLLPENFVETCVHDVCAWASLLGMEYSAKTKSSEGFPFTSDKVAEDPSDWRLAMVGLRFDI